MEKKLMVTAEEIAIELSVSKSFAYTVRIALDNKFTKTVQKIENADKAEGVALENPLMDTEYFWQVIANLENGGKTYSSIFSFETDASVRTVEIEGVSNTRDLGGFDSVYGYVQQGLIYRSARLETMTEAGREAFDKLGIKSDLDLRGVSEASSGPNRCDPLNLGDYYFAFDTPQYAFQDQNGVVTTIDSGTGINNRNNFESIKNIMSVFADKNNYPIAMHCNTVENTTVTFDSAYTLTTPTHSLNYMEFVAWKNAEGNAVAMTGTWTTDSDMELTAEWKDTRATYTITFVQAGEETKTYTVKAGDNFTEIPATIQKTGYTITWDETAIAKLTNVSENVEVVAKVAAKTYEVILNANGGTLAETKIVVTYGEAYELPSPTRDGQLFFNWTYNDIKIDSQGTWSIDADTIELIAVWGSNEWTNNY